MKKILIIFFLLFNLYSYGQSVNAPDGKSYTVSTSNQDASGFSLVGFDGNTTLLASIGLVNPPSGTTFYISNTTGLTPSSGFTLSGNKTRLVFTGTQANINNALASLKINTGVTTGPIQISVSATVNPTGFYYNPTNGHFYRPVTAGTTYTNARSAALNTTFKGQKGYLVTITSSDEDTFIYNNVPQSQIWFALTDEVTEGRWVIDAGPEKGTLIKTSNGQTAGNIVGQYNNWAGGEPNDAGGEDYAVTKWNGTQWNDLPNHFSCPYVIEYGTWSNPDDQTFTEFFNNSTIHSNGDILRVQFDFDFGSIIDETKFSVKMFTGTDNQLVPATSSSYKSLSGLGKVDMSSDINLVKDLGEGYKSIAVGGQVEWGVIYAWDGNKHRIGIDKREFPGGVLPSSITKIKLFDLYDGDVVFQNEDQYWANYIITTDLTNKTSTSSFSSYIRNGGDYFALRAEFTFEENRSLKKHSISFNEYNETQLRSLYDQIITISDVYMAFKEYSDKGIFGDQSLQYTSGIQFLNSDVNGDKVFDERDCYLLLQHLSGQSPLVSSFTLNNLMKLMTKTEFDGVTKSNWITKPNTVSSTYPINLIDNNLNSFNMVVTWKGDVNMSHSTTQTASTVGTNSSMRVMSTSSVNTTKYVEVDFTTEKINDKIVATIKVDPTTTKLMGTQFRVHYDNTLLKFNNSTFNTLNGSSNFSTDKGTYINIGSLMTNGDLGLDNKTEFKLTFTPNSTVTNTLGLITIEGVESIDNNGSKLNIRIQ